jgi:hypothetical protein
MVDDHHDYGDAAGGIHLPEPVYFPLRTRLLSGFPDHTYPRPAAHGLGLPCE